jgi:hypothetical protein
VTRQEEIRPHEKIAVADTTIAFFVLTAVIAIPTAAIYFGQRNIRRTGAEVLWLHEHSRRPAKSRDVARTGRSVHVRELVARDGHPSTVRLADECDLVEDDVVLDVLATKVVPRGRCLLRRNGSRVDQGHMGMRLRCIVVLAD